MAIKNYEQIQETTNNLRVFRVKWGRMLKSIFVNSVISGVVIPIMLTYYILIAS